MSSTNVHGLRLGFHEPKVSFVIEPAGSLLNHPWGPFPLYSLDTIQLLRIMLSCISQLEFSVVSCQHTISKYKSLVHNYVLIYFHVEPNLSLFHYHLTCKTVSISQCNLPGSCVLSDGTGTGQVNVTCPVGSTLSWSAEFKHRNISAIAVHA
jgi:hypothetical protein